MKDRFQGVKSFLELVFGLATIILTIYSFQLTDRITELENKIEILEHRNLEFDTFEIEKKNNSSKIENVSSDSTVKPK